MLHETVELMEIDICKNLTRDIPNGDSSSEAASTLSLSLSLSLETTDDLLKKGKGIFVIHSPQQQVLENGMIHVVKKFLNVRSPEPTIIESPKKELGTINCFVQAFAFAARPCVKKKHRIEDLFEIFIQESVHEPITYRGDGDIAALRIAHDEMTVWTMTVRSRNKFCMQRRKILFQSVLEFFHLARARLPGSETEVTLPQVP